MGRKEEALGEWKEEKWKVRKMSDQRKSTSCLDFAGFQDLTLCEAGQVGMEKEKLHGFWLWDSAKEGVILIPKNQWIIYWYRKGVFNFLF